MSQIDSQILIKQLLTIDMKIPAGLPQLSAWQKPSNFPMIGCQCGSRSAIGPGAQNKRHDFQ
jgi:hypothetical protein